MLPLVLLWMPFMRTARHGARTSIYLASSPEAEGVSGRFWGNRRPKRINPKWISPDAEQRIWDYCTRVCEQYLDQADSASR